MTLVQIERIGQRVANVQSDLEWIEQWNICNDKDAGKNEQDTEVHAAMLGIDQRTLKSVPHLIERERLQRRGESSCSNEK